MKIVSNMRPLLRYFGGINGVTLLASRGLREGAEFVLTSAALTADFMIDSI